MQEIEKIIVAVDPAMPRVIRGVDFPKDKDDFIRLDLLADINRVSRAHDVNTILPFELTCYSKLALQRTDHKYKNAWALSDNYFDALHQRRYVVESSCIQFREARRIYMDLSSLGDYAKPFAQQSPKMNLECIVIEVDISISQVKVI